MPVPTQCPHCQANLVSNPIPEDQQEDYDGETAFSLVIGLSDGDNIYAWVCPDCGKTWERKEALPTGYRTFDVEID